MAPTTAGEFLRDFTIGHQSQLRTVIRKGRERVRKIEKNGRMTLDMDASLYEQCSKKKEGSRMNYKGEVGYNPLFIFCAETKEMLNTHLLRGNARASSVALKFLKESLQGVVVKKGLRLRADSEFYIWEVIEFCEENEIIYGITADQTKSMKAAIEAIPEGQWRRYDDGAQVSELQFAPNRRDPHRYIVKRHHATDDKGKVYWKYHVVITNVRLRGARKVMRWALGRCAMENLIKEHKRDFGFEKMPSQKFHANWAWLLISQLAWNLVAWFSRLCLPQECHKMTVATLRHRLLNVAAKIVHQSRQRYLVLSEENRIKDWWGFAVNKLAQLKPQYT